jgi:hypothetical protein
MTDWTVSTLSKHMESLLEQIKYLIEEKDRRYDDKFAAKVELSRVSDEASSRAAKSAKELYERLLQERDTLYQSQFTAQQNAVEKALAGTERSMDLARQAIDKRLDTMNEFRAALQDQTLNYLTRAEYALQHTAIQDSLAAHITTELSRVQDQEERLDARLHGMKEDVAAKALQKDVDNITKRQDANSRWLFGMVAALFVSIVLTVVDIATRFIQ